MATVTMTREEQLERFKLLNAVDYFLSSLHDGIPEIRRLTGLTSDDTHIGEAYDLHCELWTDDGDTETQEAKLVEGESQLLAARLLACLGANHGQIPGLIEDRLSQASKWLARAAGEEA